MRKNIVSPNAPAAIGPYSQAVEINGTLYVSGQLPVNPKTGEMPDNISEQTRQALENIGAILKEAGFDFNDVVKTTVLLKNMGDFGEMNQMYASFFTMDKPARVCYEVAALPKNALIEIDAIAGK